MTVTQIKNLFKNNMDQWDTMAAIKTEEEIGNLWNGTFVEAGEKKTFRFYEKFMREFGPRRLGGSSAALGLALRPAVPAVDPSPEELIKAGLQHLIDKNAPSLVAFEPQGPICWIEVYSGLANERFPLPPSSWQTAAVGGTSSIKDQQCYSQLSYSYKGASVILQWDSTDKKYKFGTVTGA